MSSHTNASEPESNDSTEARLEAIARASSAGTAPIEAIRRRAVVRQRQATIARSAAVALMVVAASATIAAIVSRSSSEVAVVIDISPSALGDALRSGDIDAVDELLVNGADPDRSDRRTPPIVIAVAREDEALLRLLIDAGADVEATDSSGVRALHRAAGTGSLALTNVLLAAGADVSATDPLGRSPLSFAVDADDLATVDRLLDAGADPNQEDTNGRTSLYWAVWAMADLEIIDRLLASDGDPDAGSPSARDAAADKPIYLDRLG